MRTPIEDKPFAKTAGSRSATTSTYDPNATVPHPSDTSRVPDPGETQEGGDDQLDPILGLPSRYRILGPLGSGGMGVVYRAEDTRLRRTVAIKTVPHALTADARAKARFLKEAQAASALDHPNVCTIYEIEETSAGQLFLVMPCYAGETLQSRLRRGPLPLPEAIAIARQVAQGLAKAHAEGIVHCDVKPANLMLTTDGLVKILDFGIAQLVGEVQSFHSGPWGSAGYRSPEQARGGVVDPATDVWSLGKVLFEMVAGRPPSQGEQEGARRTLEPPPAPSPPELMGVLTRMLAEGAAERYRNGVSLLSALDDLEERSQENADRNGVPLWKQRRP